jgi:gluconolactonase
VRSDGLIFFTDPAFGRRPTRHDRFGRVYQPVQGVYSIHPATLEVTLVSGELFTPNGLCFSPDETSLYVADSAVSQIVELDAENGGMLKNKRVFARTSGRGHGVPDGIKADTAGNIWCTAEGGVQVYHPSGGLLGIIRTPDVSGNLCFGGDDMKTVFIGSGSDIFSLRAKVRGVSLRR